MDFGGVAAERRYWESRAAQSNNPVELDNLYRGTTPLEDELIDGMAQEIVENLDLRRDDDLLDVGCGAGVFLHRVKDRVRTACGLDLSHGLLQHLVRQRLAPVGVAEVGRIPLKNGAVNKVLCYSVFTCLHHRDYAIRTLGELVRVCRPGGRVLIGNVPYESEVRGLYRAAWESRIKIGLLPSWVRVAKTFVNQFRPGIARLNGYPPEFFLENLRPWRPRVQESRTCARRSFPRYDVVMELPPKSDEGDTDAGDVR